MHDFVLNLCLLGSIFDGLGMRNAYANLSALLVVKATRDALDAGPRMPSRTTIKKINTLAMATLSAKGAQQATVTLTEAELALFSKFLPKS